MTTRFISDLHLSDQRPAITEAFIAFLDGPARDSEALYILGDLFEVWLGDDMVLPAYARAIEAMHRLADAGVPLHVMHGNRDFLLGEAFAAMSGATLLPETQVIDLHGTPTLLLHGDTLCTDDTAYQQFRAMVRDPAWQAGVLAKSPEERLALARQFREMSMTEMAGKSAEIMDVNPDAVRTAFREAGVRQMIHGHTHRPAIHDLDLDGRPARRIVLGDWYEQGSVLECDVEGCRLRVI